MCAGVPAMVGAHGVVAGIAPNPVNQQRLESTVRYLQDAQNKDGGFGEDAGSPSDPDVSAWVTFALAAAGINPQDQRRPEGVDAFTYLAERSGELKSTTDFERALLVVDGTGTSPHSFGGVDLVREILARQLTGPGVEGAFPHEAGGPIPGMNDTIYAVLALSPIEEPTVQSAIARAIEWVIEVQDRDGGWPETTACANPGRTCRSEVDMTGAAIEALNAAGRHSTAAQEKAFEFLHTAQVAGGGFPEHAGEADPNVASTAWAVQGMWSAGVNPETWTKGSATEEPLGYMASLQQTDGHIRWKASSDMNGLWMTAEVAPAFAGQALPADAPPREVQGLTSSEETTSAAPGTAEAGQGGLSPQGGGGVIAGGGGDGAPLFSRPRPQSQGKTPGGARQLNPAKHDARSHRRNPGPPRKPADFQVAEVQAEPQPGKHTQSSSRVRGGHGQAQQGSGSGGGGAEDVKGVLISGPASQPQAGAPGLRGASAGGNQTPWLAIGIGGTLLLLFGGGAQFERRRPQVV
jgi:hypothetical protein